MRTIRARRTMLPLTLLLVGFMYLWLASMNAQQPANIVESTLLTRDQSLEGTNAPQAIRDSQVVVDVPYYGFDSRHHVGQIVVNRILATDVVDIFREIDSARFPLQSVVPIVKYAWSDDASIAVNNTSCFNYRSVSGTNRLSMHAYGRAIDVNPYLNPWVTASGSSNRPYDTTKPGTIRRGDIVYRAFHARGWTWGGDWQTSKDYQHFDKR